MPSASKLAANRDNARLGTGPKTPEGKAGAARNALKHGLLGLSFHHDTSGAESLSKLSRYENTIRRAFYTATCPPSRGLVTL